MKKLFILLAISGSIIACNDAAETESTTGGDTSATAISPAPSTDTSTSASAAPLKDSIMQFKEGKVMIMTSGSWSALAAAITTTNGRKVSPDGVVSKGGKTRKLEEGMMIDKDGQLMDKDGKMMDNTGWE